MEVEYAFQELDNLPGGFQNPEGRTKPWGTGQAVLSCKGLLKEPFAVINAVLSRYGCPAVRQLLNAGGFHHVCQISVLHLADSSCDSPVVMIQIAVEIAFFACVVIAIVTTLKKKKK